jgi:hypothetical protein
MPVKRVDNYMKEAQKMLDKKAKKGDIRKREFSEPVLLTPKGHTKIENEQKVMVKNTSIVNLDKKKVREREK